jgi:predicted anti-sigma-YlaC factor YlaD
MLKCKEITELSEDYLQNDLSVWQSLNYKMHLMMCQHCRRFVDQVTVVIRLTRAADKPIAPANLDDLVEEFTNQG